MQIILHDGTSILTKFELGEVVAVKVQTDVVGVVVAVTIMDKGTVTYDVSVAGNIVSFFEAELVETEEVEVPQGGYRED